VKEHRLTIFFSFCIGDQSFFLAIDNLPQKGHRVKNFKEAVTFTETKDKMWSLMIQLLEMMSCDSMFWKCLRPLHKLIVFLIKFFLRYNRLTPSLLTKGSALVRTKQTLKHEKLVR